MMSEIGLLFVGILIGLGAAWRAWHNDAAVGRHWRAELERSRRARQV